MAVNIRIRNQLYCLCTRFLLNKLHSKYKNLNDCLKTCKCYLIFFFWTALCVSGSSGWPGQFCFSISTCQSVNLHFHSTCLQFVCLGLKDKLYVKIRMSFCVKHACWCEQALNYMNVLKAKVTPILFSIPMSFFKQSIYKYEYML